MKYNDIEFFNVSDFRKEENVPGIILQRYPLEVQTKMGYKDRQKGPEKAKTLGGCEIRFHSMANCFEISLYSLNNDTNITVFQGDFQNATYKLQANQINTIMINKHQTFLDFDMDSKNYKRRYSTKLWRVVFDYGSTVSFISLDTFGVMYNYPTKDDLPSKTYLAYGSSITQGANASINGNCYISLFGDLNNVDVLNKGLSGTCLLEKEVIDYLLTIDCDEFIFEIGCNVRGIMDEEEFTSRFKYLISNALKTNKKIIIISMLEFFKDQYKDFIKIAYYDRNKTFTKIINEVVEGNNHGEITLISSNDLMPNLSAVAFDMLHPSNYGHLNMAINLVKILNNK